MTGAARHRSTDRVPGGPGLARRQFTTDPWVSVFLAVMVALVALVATLWPRFVLDMNSRQIPHEVSVLSAQQRDLIGVSSSTVSHDLSRDYESVEGTWGQVIDRMEQLRQDQPEPLRSLMQPGQFYADVGQPLTPDSKEGNDIRFIELQLRVDPLLADHVDLVDGQWPETVVNWTGEGSISGDVETDQDGNLVVPEPESEPVPIAISSEAASGLDWEIGELRGAPPGVELSGTFEAKDPESARWEHAPNAVTMGTLFDGNVGTTAFVAGFLGASNPGTTGPPAAVSLRFWYPLDGSAVAGDEVDLVTAQLLGLTSAQQQLSEEPLEGSTAAEPINTYLASELTGTFRDLSTQQRATASILAVVAAGPVGVTLAAFALAARLIVTRRRSTLALSTARGGSTGQVRSVLALEGLLLGLPAAGLGYAAAGLVRSGSTGWSEWVVAGLAGLVPAASLALSSGEGSLREQRADLHGRSASRVRWIAEVIVLALAGVAVWRLLDRGLTGVGVAEPTTPAPVPGGADAAPATAVQVDTGVDLLMAATPVLLALAACVLTLRLYPVPVHALTRLFRARPGLTAFLGSARSVRDPAGGLVPALAVILGISVAVFSAVMASTITIGAQSAAWSETGAEIRLSGPRVSDELLEQVQAVEGVRAAAGVREAPRTADLTGQVTARGVSVYIVDTALQQVQAGAPVLDPLPQALYAAGSATPVLTGGEVGPTSGTGELTGLGPVRVVGHVEELPGVRTDAGFLVVDRTLWEQAGGNTNPADVALIAATDPDQREQVATAVAQAIPNALIETPQEALEAFASAPVTSGLTQMFVLAVALTTALTVLAIVLVQLMGAPARARLLAVLRTLGLAPRQGRTLTAWELAPLITMAFAVGAVVGLTIPWLLLRAIDLTGLTGGSAQPPLALDWPVLGLVCGGILLTVALAVTTSAAIAARTDLARELRIGEER